MSTSSLARGAPRGLRRTAPIAAIFQEYGSSPISRSDRGFVSEADFWKRVSKQPLGCDLKGFKITDWFPRAPGVFWSERARMA